ncbi:hypothetical protein EYF80_017182 [Liparis tanakae]|uniref:Uncharacterized protein n=1 Tax=Liparis tanakae TaxID=230148 RepID=A0A4Z2I550_9TELE|nr:hypothetical protein EYF80_017182 [Liparis tanakae]
MVAEAKQYACLAIEGIADTANTGTAAPSAHHHLNAPWRMQTVPTPAAVDWCSAISKSPQIHFSPMSRLRVARRPSGSSGPASSRPNAPISIGTPGSSSLVAVRLMR